MSKGADREYSRRYVWTGPWKDAGGGGRGRGLLLQQQGCDAGRSAWEGAGAPSRP